VGVWRRLRKWRNRRSWRSLARRGKSEGKMRKYDFWATMIALGQFIILNGIWIYGRIYVARSNDWLRPQWFEEWRKDSQKKMWHDCNQYYTPHQKFVATPL
jgi:hypothetical protein